MGDSGDGGIEFFVGRQLVDHIKAILMLYGCWIRPGVEDGDVEVVFLESLDDIHHLGVAHVGAVLLECEPKDDDVASQDLDTLLEHEFDHTVGDVGTHAVVHTPASKDDLRIVTIALGALSEIVGIHSNAVTTDESGLEWQEIPLC